MSEAQVFIARLPRDTRADDIEEVFRKYGPLTRCDVRSGGVHCYAFVSYEDKRDAEDAIRGEDGREFRGNRMAVEFAKADRGRGNGGGGSRYGYDSRSRGYGRSRSRSPRGGGGRRRSRSRSRDRDRSRERGGGGRERRRSPSYGSRSRSRSQGSR